MTIGKKGLGKGLNELGLNELLSGLQTSTVNNQRENTTPQTLAVDLLRPGRYQPRKDMDREALENLAHSIRAQGIIQPILVRPIEDGCYEIIAGERRWRAAQLAEVHEVPVVVRNIPDETAIAMSLIENIQREDLNSIEEAMALQRLMDEFDMTHQEVADAVGKPRSTITNLVRLLGLSDDVRTMVERGDLEMGHARALLTLEGTLQKQAAASIVAKGLSVREAEQLVQRLQRPPNKREQKNADPDVLRLQNNLSDKLGASVTIQHGTNGRGKLVITYNSLDELDGILEHIK